MLIVFSLRPLCLQVASCHAAAGGQRALQLTPSASPASASPQQFRLWCTFTFHCPPATNRTLGGKAALCNLRPLRCFLSWRISSAAASPHSERRGPRASGSRSAASLKLGPLLSQSASASFASPLAKVGHAARAAVHPEESRISHQHHVESTQGLHAVHDPTRPDHGGAGRRAGRLSQHGGTSTYEDRRFLMTSAEAL